jgi:hypothetical protein
MKTKMELQQDIITLTTTINQKFPELSKYIMEMPENNAENHEINNRNLTDYYKSLEEFLDRYAKTHSGRIAKENIESSLFDNHQIYPSSEDI